MPIGLRNRIAHDAPTDPQWWEGAYEAMRPLIEWHAERMPCRLSEDPGGYQGPWFEVDGETLWAFNGLNHDFSVNYVSSTGAIRHTEETSHDMLLAFQHLLGKAEAQETDFKKLLSKHAPEDLKGVIMGRLPRREARRGGGLCDRPQGAAALDGAGHRREDPPRWPPRGREDPLINQEAGYLSRFGQHAHVIDVVGYGEEAWSAPRMFNLSEEPWFERFSKSAPVKTYIALEWVEGQSLEELYQDVHQGKTEPPSERQLAQWFAWSANALEAVHTNGLIHRDVKPGNLMIDEEGHLFLMDFGIARTDNENRTLVTEVGSAMGTPAYMSPEQLRAADAEGRGRRLDGHLRPLRHVLRALHPDAPLRARHRGDAHTIRTKKIEGIRPERPKVSAKGIPWELETILMGGLEPEVSDRYQSMADLERDLHCYLNDEPIGYKKPSLWRRARLTYRRNRPVANVLAGTLLLVAIALTWLYQRPGGAPRPEQASGLDGPAGRRVDGDYDGRGAGPCPPQHGPS